MQRKREDADTQAFIKLPVTHVDRMAFNARSFDELVDIGYRHTREVLRTSGRLHQLMAVTPA
jgi:hypothetical protein